MKKTQVPLLQPSEFDEYVFDTSVWKTASRPYFNQFYVIRLEEYKNHLIIPQLPHRRSVSFFIFLTKGKIVRSKALTQHEVSAGSFFFLPAFQITTFDYVSEDAEGFYCHFSSEIFNVGHWKNEMLKDFTFLQLVGQAVIEIEESLHKNIVNIFVRLESINYDLTPEKFELLSSYLYTLFVEINHCAKPQVKPLKNAALRITQQFKNALTQYIYEKHSVSDYADLLAVSPNHLHKCVKTVTGKSAHDLLDEMRVLEAKVLLKQTNLSIADIAFKIGKLDPSDFSRFFKSETGKTPKEYRQTAHF